MHQIAFIDLTDYKEKAQNIERRNRQDFPPYYSEE